MLHTVVEPDHPDFYTESYRKRLEQLADQLEKVDVTATDSDPSIHENMPCPGIAALYRLGALIYLERCMRNVPEACDRIEILVEEGMAIVGDACEGNCSSPFLLMLFGAEARTDRQRAMILRLIGNTERFPEVRNISSIKDMIKFVWIQDDLGTKWTSYKEKLRAVLGTCSIAPTFM